MAKKKIHEFLNKPTPVSADMYLLEDSTTGIYYNVTQAQLLALIASGVTLQQVLTNNPSTGGLGIKSPDASSFMYISNGDFYAQGGYSSAALIANNIAIDNPGILDLSQDNAQIASNNGSISVSESNSTRNRIQLYIAQTVIRHSIKNYFDSPLNEVSQNATTALGIVTLQQLQAYALTSGSTAGGDLSGTYPNPAVNTINSITKSFYDPTSSIQTQLNGKEVTTNKDASNGYAGLTLFKINFKNALNTITSFFTNSNTASRTYTFPDKDGIVAMTSDLTGGTILGSLGTTGIGKQIPFNSGVANTVTGSDNITAYNVGATTAIILNNPSTSQVQGVSFYEGGNGSFINRYGSALTSSNFTGTAFVKSNVLTLEGGNALTNPIFLMGTPIINGIGTVSTNGATRLDSTGLRIGTMADIHTANTAKLQIGAGSATANTSPIKLTSGVLMTTAEVGAIEFLNDALYATITTGAVRKQVAFTSDITGTNSGTNTGDNANNTQYSGLAQNYNNNFLLMGA